MTLTTTPLMTHATPVGQNESTGTTPDTHPMTASKLWATAADITPRGHPWSGSATHCVMCSADVAPGDLAVPTKAVIDDAFNFKLDCHTAGEAVCGHCLAVWDKPWMQANSKSYAVHGQGVFHLRTKEDITAWLLQPPTAPYVAIFNIRQQAQMIWRAPVGIPNYTHLTLRLDDTLLLIDRERVLAAVRAWQVVAASLADFDKPKAQAYMLSYDMSSTTMGKPQWLNRIAVIKHSDQGKAAIALLDSLTAADWWALCACRDVNLDAPDTWPKRRVCEWRKPAESDEETIEELSEA